MTRAIRRATSEAWLSAATEGSARLVNTLSPAIVIDNHRLRLSTIALLSSSTIERVFLNPVNKPEPKDNALAWAPRRSRCRRVILTIHSSID
jgi:hypothetical protein